MVEQTTFFCEECNKEIKIPKNLIGKTNAVEKAKERHCKAVHSLTLGYKFKLHLKNKEDKNRLNNYFDEYAKAVIFAINAINKLKSNFNFIGKKETNKWVFPKDKCSFCNKDTNIAYISKKGKKICNPCYQKEFGESGIRKKLYATRGRKVNPSYNIFNATKKLAKTHYHSAIKDAFQLLETNVKQKSQRIERLLRDKRRLKKFEEMLEDPEKRFELPKRKRQREARYIHISQKERANELKGYTLKEMQEKIKILKRNIEREEKSLIKKSLIVFKGNRIIIFPQGIKFDVVNNKVKISISKELPKVFEFSGTNVANVHGQKFFAEKLEEIAKQKPKYAYI